MSVWYDERDPANDEPPTYNDHKVGCGCDQCAWEAHVREAEAYLATRPAECAACGDTGWISFTWAPYSKGFGNITEAVPCACRSKR